MTFSNKNRSRSRHKKSTPQHVNTSIRKCFQKDSYGLSFLDYENMMCHDRRHKKSGGGSRINTHQINQPLRWNEVTEDAHWYAHGNASVVANNARN